MTARKAPATNTSTTNSTAASAGPLLLTSGEMAAVLRVSEAFLQKDRRERQQIPFIRLGDRIFYHREDALAAVRGLAVGGVASRRKAGRPASAEGGAT